MISKKTAQKIKIKLIKMDMSQQALAEKLGISRQQLNNVINGQVENLAIEVALLELLGVK